MKIHKYTLPLHAVSNITMPQDAVVLSVQLQNNAITLWAEVSPDLPPEERTFHIVGTGDFTPRTPTRYIGTVQHTPYVWHIYEELT